MDEALSLSECISTVYRTIELLEKGDILLPLSYLVEPEALVCWLYGIHQYNSRRALGLRIPFIQLLNSFIYPNLNID
jgi:hypothetical protein